jgi:hypothetical protein
MAGLAAGSTRSRMTHRRHRPVGCDAGHVVVLASPVLRPEATLRALRRHVEQDGVRLILHRGFVVFSPMERAAFSMTLATAAGWEM